jgi:hypothetical protein
MDEIEILIEDCLNRYGRMNDWEKDFMASVRDQYEKRRKLTALQEEKLNDIWERVTTKK